MDKRQKAVREYLLGGCSYRQLEEKYGISHATLNRCVIKYKARQQTKLKGVGLSSDRMNESHRFGRSTPVASFQPRSSAMMRTMFGLTGVVCGHGCARVLVAANNWHPQRSPIVKKVRVICPIINRYKTGSHQARRDIARYLLCRV
jgi:transposase-like protein